MYFCLRRVIRYAEREYCVDCYQAPGRPTPPKDVTNTIGQPAPPVDPSFHFLADSGRDPNRGSSDPDQDSRRHVANYGGKNFDNVKKQMLNDQKV